MREFPNVATSTSSGGLTATRWHVFAHAVAFVLGFSAIFIIVWGGAATVLGSVLYDIKPILSKVGGVIVIVLGLATLGVIRIPLLYRDTRPQWSRATNQVGLGSSALLGVFFAAGWTPCIGTTLGAILTLGLSGQATGQAMLAASEMKAFKKGTAVNVRFGVKGKEMAPQTD